MSQTMPIVTVPARAKALPRSKPSASQAASAETVARRLESVGALRMARRLAEDRQVPLDWILGRVRYKRVAAARRELWALLYGSLAPMSLPEIGYLVGRDHTTILYALRLREREVLGLVTYGKAWWR